MKFHIYECRLTFELCGAAKLSGINHVWTPTRTVIKKHRQTLTRRAYTEEVKEPVVPGYVYVPADRSKEFRLWAPNKFNVKQLQVSTGQAGMTKLEALLALKPAVVDLKDLKDHEAAVKELQKALANSPLKSNFNTGDTVELVMVDGSQPIKGTIFCFLGGNRAKVRTDLGGITVKISKLSKLNSSSQS